MGALVSWGCIPGPWMGASLDGVPGAQLSALRHHMGYGTACWGQGQWGAEIRVPTVGRPDRAGRLRMGGGSVSSHILPEAPAMTSGLWPLMRDRKILAGTVRGSQQNHGSQ